MIIVKIVKDNKTIKSVTTSGHAGYAKSGKDIVCAAVSAVVVGSVNAVIKLTNKEPKTVVDDGYLHIEFASDANTQQIAEVMIAQLETIERDYQKFIRIEN